VSKQPPQPQQQPSQRPAAVPPPIVPRPKLLILLCVIFAAWIGALLAMYFTTVYPERHHPPATQTATF
jgi:hypothetical protein